MDNEMDNAIDNVDEYQEQQFQAKEPIFKAQFLSNESRNKLLSIQSIRNTLKSRYCRILDICQYSNWIKLFNQTQINYFESIHIATRIQQPQQQLKIIFQQPQQQQQQKQPQPQQQNYITILKTFTDNLTIKQIKKIKQQYIYNLFQQLLASVSQIYFPNLINLQLPDNNITNVEFLAWINAPVLASLYLNNNRIVNVQKGLNKIVANKGLSGIEVNQNELQAQQINRIKVNCNAEMLFDFIGYPYGTNERLKIQNITMFLKLQQTQTYHSLFYQFLYYYDGRMTQQFQLSNDRSLICQLKTCKAILRKNQLDHSKEFEIYDIFYDNGNLIDEGIQEY